MELSPYFLNISGTFKSCDCSWIGLNLNIFHMRNYDCCYKRKQLVIRFWYYEYSNLRADNSSQYQQSSQTGSRCVQRSLRPQTRPWPAATATNSYLVYCFISFSFDFVFFPLSCSKCSHKYWIDTYRALCAQLHKLSAIQSVTWG